MHSASDFIRRDLGCIKLTFTFSGTLITFLEKANFHKINECEIISKSPMIHQDCAGLPFKYDIAAINLG